MTTRRTATIARSVAAADAAKATAAAETASTSNAPDAAASDDDGGEPAIGSAVPPDSEVAARLRLVVARLGRTVRQHAAAGLSPSQLSALATVEEHGPVRMSDLAAFESVGPPVATRVVDSIERLGLVKRVADPTDKRACLIELTSAGRRTLAELWTARAAVLTKRIGRLTPAQSAALVAAMPALEALTRDGHTDD